jgi:hypothetical protein
MRCDCPSLSLLYGVAFLGIILNAPYAVAAPFHIEDIPNWFHNAFPQKGHGIRGEIKW